ncbi:hypothetical protein BN1708_014975 [Verticillium longisporum]|uniref:Uncharacterized protein n=1 Tax=Verticillium longisporum TaxID=100787 RepID=A0A0G4M0R3_VERLO|nr:hypothetical protein BN1708_014975 [Verticillium longisporum]
MSGLINKIKDAVHSDKHDKHDSTHTGSDAYTTGTHGTTGNPGIHHNTDTTGTHSTGTHGTSTYGNTSTNAGPHDSNLANKADPRVDSDRDHRGTAGGVTGSTGTHGSTGLGSSGYGNTSTNAGPHDSNIANKLDPRVDSDRDNRGTAGGVTGSTGTYGSSTTHGTTGTHGSTGLGSSGYGNTSTNAGPHDSNLANKADPRVDSDRDHRGTTGTGYGSSTTGTYGSSTTGASTGTYGSSTTGSGGIGSGATGVGAGATGLGSSGYGNTSTNTGPHDSNLANKADPRVDSDRDYRGTTGTYGSSTTGTGYGSSTTGTGYGSSTTGTGYDNTTSGLGSSVNPGPAPNTAGPHSKDFLNKADPRVDSDRDGSKTVGQDKTYASDNTTSYAQRDPTDAAQVPPSVLQQTIGAPQIAHDDHGHDRARRNSKATAQEVHRGL